MTAPLRIALAGLGTVGAGVVRLLAENPLCEDCSAEKATHLHHIVPRSHGGPDLDESNLVALCSACHRKRHEPLIYLMKRN